MWTALLIYLVLFGLPCVIIAYRMRNWKWKDDDYRGGY